MRRALLLLPLLAAACGGGGVRPNQWYGTAQIVCQRADCPHCRGTRGVGCGPCRATGGVKCDSCKDGTQKCGTCDGDGQKHGKKCGTCDGDGRTSCWTCGGDRIKTCDHCDGKGRICCLQPLPISEPPVSAPEDAWPPGSLEKK